MLFYLSFGVLAVTFALLLFMFPQRLAPHLRDGAWLRRIASGMSSQDGVPAPPQHVSAPSSPLASSMPSLLSLSSSNDDDEAAAEDSTPLLPSSENRGTVYGVQ